MMDKRCDISIALTTFNGEKFLREQLDSIYAQTLLPTEVIACDDGSSDDTISILEEYKHRYGLNYFVNATPLGINKNFLKAISLCHGEYIALCDQDDIWQKEKLAKTLAQIERLPEGPKAVSTQALDIDEQQRPITVKKTRYWNQRATSSILLNTCSQGCTMMINRALAEYLDKLTTTFPHITECTMYDALIGIIAASIGSKYNLPEKTILYRHHSRNAVGTLPAHHTPKELRHLRPRYHYSLPDDRLSTLRTLYALIKDDIKRPAIHTIYQKAQQMEQASTIWTSLLHFLSIQDLPLGQKLYITLFATSNQLLKYVWKD